MGRPTQIYSVAVCGERLPFEKTVTLPQLHWDFKSEWNQSEFFIAPTHMNCDGDLDGEIVGKVERLGVAIAYVKDRRALIRPDGNSGAVECLAVGGRQRRGAARNGGPGGGPHRQPPPTMSALPPRAPPPGRAVAVGAFVPGIQPCHGGHHQDPANGGDEMQAEASRTLGEHEVTNESQEHAEAENLQRTLPAQDQWP